MQPPKAIILPRMKATLCPSRGIHVRGSFDRSFHRKSRGLKVHTSLKHSGFSAEMSQPPDITSSRPWRTAACAWRGGGKPPIGLNSRQSSSSRSKRWTSFSISPLAEKPPNKNTPRPMIVMEWLARADGFTPVVAGLTQSAAKTSSLCSMSLDLVGTLRCHRSFKNFPRKSYPPNMYIRPSASATAAWFVLRPGVHSACASAPMDQCFRSKSNLYTSPKVSSWFAPP
mmetsp:Transcript_98143/g.273117  ORF Transcript_98143/g.273117 Transcript_98143/m.273117 type:complete len:227 (-) Transcript_98143:199-879(-)